jgi:hypothetical protein
MINKDAAAGRITRARWRMRQIARSIMTILQIYVFNLISEDGERLPFFQPRHLEKRIKALAKLIIAVAKLIIDRTGRANGFRFTQPILRHSMMG